MKIKNLFAILLVLTILTCTCVLPASAKGTTNNSEFELIINDEVSEETKTKIEKYFATGEPATDDEFSTYGLTCTLFGHNTKISSVSVVTHKVRTTSPRCKKETYNYEECTRCEYNNATLIDTEYIVCCS